LCDSEVKLAFVFVLDCDLHLMFKAIDSIIMKLPAQCKHMLVLINMFTKTFFQQGSPGLNGTNGRNGENGLPGMPVSNSPSVHSCE